MTFQNAIGNATIINIQVFMRRHKTPDATAEYVRANMLYYREILFLYHMFKCMDVPSTKDNTIFQVECALLMHSMGHYIEDKHSFSKKMWGHWTAIYTKLVKEVSDSQWNRIYGGLEYTEGVVRKLDLSHLCFSLNFLFSYVASQFPSMFLLLTYSQSFFSLSADYPRHSRRRRSKIRFD